MRAFTALLASTLGSVAFQMSVDAGYIRHFTWAVPLVWGVCAALWAVWLASHDWVKNVWLKDFHTRAGKTIFLIRAVIFVVVFFAVSLAVKSVLSPVKPDLIAQIPHQSQPSLTIPSKQPTPKHSPSTPHKNIPIQKQSGTNNVQIGSEAHIEVQTNAPNSAAVGINTGIVSVISGDSGLIQSLKLSFTFDVPTDRAEIDTSVRRSLGLMCPAGLFDNHQKLYRLVTDGQFEDWQVSEGMHRFGFVYVPTDDSGLIGRKVEVLASIAKFAFDCSDFLRVTNKVSASPPSDIGSYDLVVRINGIAVVGSSGQTSLKYLSSMQNNLDLTDIFTGIGGLYSRAVAAQAVKQP